MFNKLLKSDNPNIKNIILKRSTIKRTVMTIPYNISLMGVGFFLTIISRIYKDLEKELFLRIFQLMVRLLLLQVQIRVY
jgi:hypothetical protein